MRNKKLKFLAVFTICLMVLSASVCAGYAANGYMKRIEAWFGLNSIKYNDVDLTSYVQPFAWEGTTYVPLRKLAEMFDKNVTWDQATRTVILTDNPDPMVDTLNSQLNSKNYQISQLEARIKELEEELAAYEDEVGDIDDLEDELNDNYYEYEDIEFDISLSGDEDEITVKIEADLDEYEDEWDDLSTSDKEDYLQDICDDILDVFEDAEISGYIRDISRSGTYKVLTFYTTSSGAVRTGSSSDSDIDDLEDELDDRYCDELGDTEVTIELEGDEDEIEFFVYIDLDEYDDEWEDLSEDDIYDFMYDIYDDIKDEFDDAEITGYICDSSDNDEELYEFYKDEDSNSLVLE